MNDSPDPFFPVVQTGLPTSVPVRPLPDASAVVVPVPSPNPYPANGTVAGLMVRVSVVVRIRAPAVPVIVTVTGPTGVVAAVVIVIVVLHAGLQLVGENDADAPVGRPDAEKITGCGAPETNAAEIVDVATDPCVTDLFPLFDSEKSNGTPWVVADADGESVDVFPA